MVFSIFVITQSEKKEIGPVNELILTDSANDKSLWSAVQSGCERARLFVDNRKAEHDLSNYKHLINSHKMFPALYL